MKACQKFLMAVCLLLSTVPLAFAQSYPTNMIRLIVPFPAGATTDFIGRVFADYLRRKTGQAVVVENIPGAGGNIGMAAAAKADANGYTLILTASSLFAINPHLYKNLSFDPMKDITPVGLFGQSPTIFAVISAVPAQTLSDFLALAKKNPLKYTYASAGIGTPLHLSVARLASLSGVELLHVPYSGGAAAINDLIAGRIDLIGIDPNSILQYVQDGTLRTLAVAADERLSVLPNLPTTAEAGLKDFTDYVWWGVGAPSRTPQPVLDQINALARDAVKDSAFAQKLEAIHMQLLSEGRQQIESRVKAENKRWGDFILAQNIKLN